MLKIGLVAIAVGACASSASAQQPSSGNAIAEGHRLALSKCDACHIVAADQQYRPLVANLAPSFFEIANRPNTAAGSLEAYLTRPHTYQGIPYPDLTPAEVSNLISYILSLRG
jgi:mono/diheme cytochrome c family protein